MAQDFANGPRRNRTPRSDPRRSRRQPSAFHWGSFGAGVALGIACTLAGALLPEWWGVPAITSPTAPPAAGEPTPITRFEFFDRLPNEKTASRANARDPLPATSADAPPEFLLQAGSFTNKEDAERLRTTLSQSGWNTETATVTLSSGAIRHRVIVGPFSSSQDTQHAISELRKQDVDALVLARKSVAG